MNEKQRKAAKIKELIAQLRQEIEEAKQLGLSVVIEAPHRDSLSKRQLSVEVTEIIAY